MRTSLPDFYRGLAAFLRAGMVMDAAVAALRANGTLDGSLGGSIEAAVRGGESLAAALERRPDRVPREDLAVIEAAEATGRLEETLDRLARLHEERRLTGRRLLAENAYNLLLIHACAIVMPFGLLHAARSFSTAAWMFWTLAVLVPLYGLGAAAFLASRTERGRERLQRVLERLPAFGAAARHLRRARFAQVLLAAYDAGMSVERALPLAGRAVNARTTEEATALVAQGNRLAAALAVTGMLSPRSVQQIEVAEQAGELSEALARIATEESVEADLSLKRALLLFTRGFYVLIALAVFFYALRMLSPLMGGS